MHVITLINEKGGVGKTTLAVHAAMGLAHRGHRVMLIDADPQGHATVRCSMPKAPGLYDLLVRDKDFKEVLMTVPAERYGIPGESLPRGVLWVLPSNVETRNIANSISDADAFALRLEELEGHVDVVIIDTSPTPSLLHGAIYSATDSIIYPTKLTYTSFDGLVESIKRRMASDKIRAQRWNLPAINVMGIVPMEYRANTNEQQENLAELQKQFPGMVWPAVHQRTVWTESESRALPVFNIDPMSMASVDAWELIDRCEEVIRVKA